MHRPWWHTTNGKRTVNRLKVSTVRHVNKDCPKQCQPMVRKCFACGTFGHTAKDCCQNCKRFTCTNTNKTKTHKSRHHGGRDHDDMGLSDTMVRDHADMGDTSHGGRDMTTWVSSDGGKIMTTCLSRHHGGSCRHGSLQTPWW